MAVVYVVTLDAMLVADAVRVVGVVVIVTVVVCCRCGLILCCSFESTLSLCQCSASAVGLTRQDSAQGGGQGRAGGAAQQPQQQQQHRPCAELFCDLLLKRYVSDARV